MYIPVLTAVVEETEKEDETMLYFVLTRLHLSVWLAYIIGYTWRPIYNWVAFSLQTQYTVEYIKTHTHTHTGDLLALSVVSHW